MFYSYVPDAPDWYMLSPLVNTSLSPYIVCEFGGVAGPKASKSPKSCALPVVAIVM